MFEPKVLTFKLKLRMFFNIFAEVLNAFRLKYKSI